MTIFKRLYPLRFLFITAGVLAYFTWIQPVLLVALRRAMHQPNYQLGLILVAIQVLNIIAIFYKGPVVQERIANITPVSGALQRILQDARLFIIMVTSMSYVAIVTTLVNWTILSMFGIDIRGTPPLWEGLTGFFYLFIMVILNAVGMLIVVIPHTAHQIQLPAWLRPSESPRLLVEFLAEIILAVFGVTAYTLIWELYAANVLFSSFSPQSDLAEFLGVSVFFWMVYPATNLLSTVDEWLTHRPFWLRLVSLGGLLLIMISAIGNLTGT